MLFSEDIVYKDTDFTLWMMVEVVALLRKRSGIDPEVLAFLEAENIGIHGSGVVEEVGHGCVSLSIEIVGEYHEVARVWGEMDSVLMGSDLVCVRVA